jgi:hypothetical protein
MRKPCKECPWVTDSSHNEKWKDYVQRVETIGKVKDKKHACHMITSDVWGYKHEIDETTICAGSYGEKKVCSNSVA